MAIITIRNNKKMDVPIGISASLVEFDNDSIKQQIDFPLIVGNNNLNSMEGDIFLLIQNTLGYDEVKLDEKILNEETGIVSAYWNIKRTQIIPDKIQIQIQVKHKTEDMVWSTEIRELTVSESLDLDGNIVEIYPTILEQLQTDVNENEARVQAVEQQVLNIISQPYIQEAPIDGVKYVRQNENWVEDIAKDYVPINNDTAEIDIVNTNVSTIEVLVLDTPKLGGLSADQYIQKSETINASSIIFNDGESLQFKFDNGIL